MIHWRILLAGLIFALCLFFNDALVRDPVTHMALQFPLLAVSGALLFKDQHVFQADWNKGGIACLLIALITIAYWMLPRTIDAVLSDPIVNAAKFVTLPLFAGFLLKAGWEQAHPLVRGMLKSQAVSMLAILAFLYTHAPVRLCNAYLSDQQERLGYTFLIAAGFLTVFWVLPLFAASEEEEATNHSTLRSYS